MLTCFLALALVAPLPQGVQLSGVVSGPNGPLAGAMVFVSRARPRQGVAVLCASCYPDCRKHTETDEKGRFVLGALDPELQFQLLVQDDGYVPIFSEEYIDPRQGNASVMLEVNDLGHRDPERVLHGRIVDAHGDPVARALVSADGRMEGDSMMFGPSPGVDPLAVSDEHGDFALGVARPGDKLQLSIEAPAFAPLKVQGLRAGPDVHSVTLGRGVTVTGIVQKDGKPLGGVELGLFQQNHAPEVYTGVHAIGTDAAGRFTFVNVPPAEAWYLYGTMVSFRAHGALVSRPVRTSGEGSTLDVGILAVEPAAKLSGRVVLSDGLPLPDGMKVLISRENAWDSQLARVAQDGSFAFEGLPHELGTLYAQVAGYVISPKNASCDFLNGSGLIGLIQGDVQDLVLLLEPGQEESVFTTAGLGRDDFRRYEALQRSPLRGAPVESSVAPR